MQPIPDPLPYFKYGIAGVLLFIIVVIVIVGGVVGVKVAAVLVQRIPTKTGTGDNVLSIIEQAQTLRDAQKQLDNIKAGSQPVEFWIKQYDASAARANEPLVKRLDGLERAVAEGFAQIIREIRQRDVSE